MKKDQEIFQERLNHLTTSFDGCTQSFITMTICLQSSATRCTSILQHADARSKPRPGKRKKSGLVPPEGYAWHDALY